MFLLAGVNVLKNETATIGGVAFTLSFLTLLTFSERRIAHEKQKDPASEGRRAPEHFRLETRHGLTAKALGVAAGGIVVGVHDPDRLEHPEKLLARDDVVNRDIVLVAVKTDGAEEGAVR